MPYQFTTNGLQFGPNQSGKTYLCANWHRGDHTSSPKSKWNISHQAEYDIFCTADENEWSDEPGNYWGVKNGEVIGKNFEVIAKFPCPQNSDDCWHGYPVLTCHEKPPRSLIEKWEEIDQISRSLARRIKKGKV